MQANTIRLILTLAVTACLAGPVAAQVNPFASSRALPALTEQDKQLVIDSGRQLNEAPSPAVGQSVNWRGAKGTAHGITSLTRVYQYRGLTCHALHYRIARSNQQPLRDYNIDWCKTPDGWKIKS